MSQNVKKNNGAEDSGQGPVGVEESAQFEVFKNGKLERAQIEQWLRNDIQSIRSLCEVIWSEQVVFEALVDTMYARYQKFHEKIQQDVEKTDSQSGS